MSFKDIDKWAGGLFSNRIIRIFALAEANICLNELKSSQFYLHNERKIVEASYMLFAKSHRMRIWMFEVSIELSKNTWIVHNRVRNMITKKWKNQEWENVMCDVVRKKEEVKNLSKTEWFPETSHVSIAIRMFYWCNRIKRSNLKSMYNNMDML